LWRVCFPQKRQYFLIDSFSGLFRLSFLLL